MAYKGRYTPTNPKKYKGNPYNIIYRSLWERKFMVYCDTNDKIIEWGSEEIIIPYLSPWDGKVHRYFPDFYIKVKQSNDNIKKFIIEVKPKKQTKPPKPVERKTKRWINEVRTFGINEAKWKHASKWCKNNDMEFKILTEDDLGIRYK
tara:strand:+ start:3325 stop:3768 length:444 start_codon:yes stop_codon:yes gene_type:complete